MREKHRLTKHPLYGVWRSMKQRCYNPNRREYPHYGGRGIGVCHEWNESFKAFYDWAIGNGYNKDLSIDRVDNNKDYTPKNCRWATWQEQSHNKRRSHCHSAKYIGVTKDGASYRWKLQHKGKTHQKRGFESINDALNARNKFIEENNLPHKIQNSNQNTNEE